MGRFEVTLTMLASIISSKHELGNPLQQFALLSDLRSVSIISLVLNLDAYEQGTKFYNPL